MASRFGSLQQFIRRHRRIIQAVFFPIAAVSAFFYLFVLTAMVALDVLKYPSWFVAFGVFLYVQMWMIATDSAMDAVSELYGIKLLPWWRREFVPILPKRAQPRSRGALIGYFFLSYAIGIYGFALAYVAVSRYFIGSL